MVHTPPEIVLHSETLLTLRQDSDLRLFCVLRVDARDALHPLVWRWTRSSPGTSTNVLASSHQTVITGHIRGRMQVTSVWLSDNVLPGLNNSELGQWRQILNLGMRHGHVRLFFSELMIPAVHRHDSGLFACHFSSSLKNLTETMKIEHKSKPVVPVKVVSEVTTLTDQYDGLNKVMNLSSLPLNPQSTTILKKELNFSL
ncbi:unnamed protein product [Protopolystoma xenopodis]|uniref:Ig-like domain-containing protein n=1 Tax=Protopolystoma xenopodis TaxID=117903 RepID=A0A3S5AE28_9PLAT|nr:unnamed protein product [Protopolystoma xenopodis]